MRAVLQSLAGFEGPKSVILISEGLIFEGLGGETDDLAAIAADSRASIDVLLLDVPRFDAAQSTRPTTPREDRDLQVTGLEQLAGASRGELYRINITAEFAFDRISRALDGYYLLGVESRPEDRNGRRHRIGVKSAAARRDDPLAPQLPDVDLGEGDDAGGRRDARDSIAAADQRSAAEGFDVDLQAARRQQGPRLVAAEVERLAGQPLDYTVGMAIVNKQGRGLAPPVELKTAHREGRRCRHGGVLGNAGGRSR